MRTSRGSLINFLSLIPLLALLGMGSRTLWPGTNVWTSLGPDGGSIMTLAIDPQHPSTLYAGTGNGGIFKSTDAGASWMKANSGLPVGRGNLALVIDPQNPSTLYTGGFGAVYKSTDGGANWSSSALPPFGVRSLAIDPKNPNTLYAGLVRGAFKTTDGGASWNTISSALPPEAVFNAVMIDPENSDTLYAVTSTGLFKSANGGASWRAIDSGVTGHASQSLAIDPQNPGTLYLSESFFENGIASGGVFKSIDGGASWVNSGLLGSYFLAIDPQSPNTVYAVAVARSLSGNPPFIGFIDGEVFKSTDGGASWGAINSGLTSGVNRLAVDPQNAGTVYAAGGRDSGVFKTTDGGTSWRAVNSGIRLTSVTALAVDPQTSSTLFAGSVSELSKTTDLGKSWTSANSGLPNVGPVSSVAVDPHDSGTIYAGTWDYVMQETTSNYPGITYPPLAHSKVFKSTDGGANWSSVLDLGTFGQVSFAFDRQNPGTVYAAGAGSVFKSIDTGASWVSLYSNRSFFVEGLVIDPQNPSTLYVAGWGGIFKSTDGGTNWEAADFGMTYVDPSDNKTYPYGVTRLLIDPQAPSTLYANAYPTSDYGDAQIFKSTDDGASWSALNSRPDCYVADLAISARNPSTLYAGTGCGVFKSTDGGMSWTTVNSGLTTVNVSILVIDPQNANTVYAGTFGGSVFAITFGPDLVVTDLQFDRTSVKAGGSFSVNVSGPNLTSQTFLDVRLTTPGGTVSDIVLNWQRGVATGHVVPVGTAPGIWTINGARAHEIETDHTGDFVPVSAAITVSP